MSDVCARTRARGEPAVGGWALRPTVGAKGEKGKRGPMTRVACTVTLGMRMRRKGTGEGGESGAYGAERYGRA